MYYYLWSSVSNKVFEYNDIDDFQAAKDAHPEDIELTLEQAYMKLFERISKTMKRRFDNYKNLDIQQECFCMLLNRYRLKGTYAPDKPWLDNEKIWWKVSKKCCLYILREYTNIVSELDIWDLDDNEKYIVLAGCVEDTYDLGESKELCKEIKQAISKLCKSNEFVDQQMGIFATCKLEKFTDAQTCQVLNIKMSRFYEIRRGLKEYFNIQFRNII